jgi:hypothetical protein
MTAVRTATHRSRLPARTVRLVIGCFDAATCSSVHVLVSTRGPRIDEFDIGGTDFATRTYEVPGTNLVVDAFNTDDTMQFETALFGRGN